MAYDALGDYTAAGSRYQSSLKIWEELGKLEETAAVLARLGTVQAGAGRYADALSSYQRSLALTRELGNHERLRELQDAIATVQRLARQTGPGPGAK
jgi:tetratricopeptide (TPR) repeat protein